MALTESIYSRVPRVRHGHIQVAAGPLERDRLKLFLAVLLPHDAGHNRQRWLNLCSGTRAPVSLTMT